MIIFPLLVIVELVLVLSPPNYPPIMEPSSRSLGASSVLEYWRVRVFSSFCMVDILSVCLSVRTIFLSGCIYICSCYIPLSYQY